PQKAKSSSSEYHYQKFEIPNSWKWITLPEACLIPITDGTHQTPTYSDKDNGVPFLSSKDVTSRSIDWNNIKYITKSLHEELYKRIAPQKWDILLAKNGTTGVAAMVETDAIFDIYVTLALIRPALGYIHPKYLLYVINSNFCKEQFNTHLTGIGLPNLHLIDIQRTMIPLPPYKEQIRIADKLDEYLYIIDKVEEDVSSLALLVSNTKSKILELAMQGKLVPQNPTDEPATDILRRVNPKARIITDNPHSWNIPNSWCWCQLGDIFEHNTGKALNAANQEGLEMEYLTTSNVYWNRFELDNLKKMPFKDSEIDKCQIVKGDLLVCEGGDVGRAAIWDKDYSLMIQNHLHRLRPMDKNMISVPLYCFLFKFYKNKGLIGGKGIALQGFSSNALHKLIIPLIPVSEQKRIIIRINKLFAILDEIEASLQS
ncbi:restriction endonuclease subunit S, partial [uncultured Duncaniella sp.]|uniref:restriction endonuclease subunit S n=1 Tax=uncultured Duncaniella sp. TaxID=2768039 RepID=UPI0026F3AE8B